MAGTVIEAAERRLLSGILALVLDEQHGQATAAFEALRRKAAASQVTGGALKNVFERLAAEERPPPSMQPRVLREQIRRLQTDLVLARSDGSRLAAENGALHHELAETKQRLAWLEQFDLDRRVSAGVAATTLRLPEPPPRYHGGVMVGMLLTLLTLVLVGDRAAPAFARHAPGPPPLLRPAAR